MMRAGLWGTLNIIGLPCRSRPCFGYYFRGVSFTHTPFALSILLVFLFFLVPDDQVSRCGNECCCGEREYGVVSECGEDG